MQTLTRRATTSPRSLARIYFAIQGLAGATWWIMLALSDDVRRWTLGDWNPLVLAGPDLVLFVGGSVLAAARGQRVVAAAVAVWTTGVTLALTGYGLVERTAGPGVVLMATAAAGTLTAAATLWFGRLPTHWFFTGPFAFHVATARSGASHLGRSLSQLVVFWSTFFLLIPAVMAFVEDRLRLAWPVLQHERWDLVGGVMFALASALGLWSCVTMAIRGEGTPLPAQTARNLVVAGPYRSLRNPMAVAGGAQVVGIGLWRGSWTVVVIAVAGAVAWHLVIRPGEEANLADRFGASYQRYRAAVRCWIPTAPWIDPGP